MVRFTIPISGRLELEKQSAGAEHAAELARVAQEEWRVRMAVRRAWTEWSALELELQTTREFVDRIEALRGVVDALERAGELPRINARLFRIEHATRVAEVTMLQARLREAALTLRQLMGLAPTASVVLARDGLGSPAYEGPAPAAPDGSDLGARSPLMLVALAEHEARERELALEIRKQIPDLQLGPGYGQLDGADEFMLGIGLPIPILNANRLAIAQAKARRELARAEAEIALERLMASAQAAQVRLEAAASVRAQYEQEVIPMVDAQYADARRVAELGEVDTFVLLETLVRQQRAKIELIQARRHETLARIDIEEVIGPVPVAAKEKQP
jgi:outer membrane protein TolC